MKYHYYYNNIPEFGLTRNNLVYTSLLSEDQKTFVQWFHNDSEYHKGQNEIVNLELMKAKWEREVKYLLEMSRNYEDKIPKILDIDHNEQKIYLKVDGPDFWNRANCKTENYSEVLPDWKEQMLSIIKAHKSLDLYKYSMHPSSYFLDQGRLKSINYFFCYHKNEGPISIADHTSHIYSTRQEILKKQSAKMKISWNEPETLDRLQILCFESFRSNYTNDFIESAKKIYD